MERISYWITIDEPDGTMVHVAETMDKVLDYLLPMGNRNFSVEKVTEEDVTGDVEFRLACLSVPNS